MPRPRSYLRLTSAQRTEIESFMHAVLSRDPPDRAARRRAQAIRHSDQGKSVQEISQCYGRSIRAVWSWFAAYRRQGVQGLLSRSLEKQLSHLQRAKLWQMKYPPDRHAMSAWHGRAGQTATKPKEQKKRWTYPRLAQWVKKNWGMSVSPRRLGQLLARYKQNK